MSERILVANRERSGAVSAPSSGVATQQVDAGDPLVVVEIEE